MKELSRRKQHVPCAKKNFLQAEHWNFTPMQFMRKKGLLLAIFVIQALHKDLNWKPILKEGISMLFENISKVTKGAHVCRDWNAMLSEMQCLHHFKAGLIYYIIRVLLKATLSKDIMSLRRYDQRNIKGKEFLFHRNGIKISYGGFAWQSIIGFTIVLRVKS